MQDKAPESGMDYFDPDQINQLVKRLVPLAFAKIDRMISSKLDPEDIVQSVFRNFYTELNRGKLKPASWEEMWLILAKMTVWNCGHKNAHYRTKARNIRLESPLEAEARTKASPSGSSGNPEDEAILHDTLEKVLGLLPGEQFRSIFLQSLRGLSPAEIAENLHISKRTVERSKMEIRETLLQVSEKDIVE